MGKMGSEKSVWRMLCCVLLKPVVYQEKNKDCIACFMLPMSKYTSKILS